MFMRNESIKTFIGMISIFGKIVSKQGETAVELGQGKKGTSTIPVVLFL